MDSFDDPNTAVNKLTLSLRKLEFSLDFASSKLKAAHGEAATAVLDFLAQKAVEKNFRWQKPEYLEEPEEQAEVDEEADVGCVEDEIEAADFEDEAVFKESDYVKAYGEEEEEEDDEDRQARDILTSGIDPVAWRTEVERVAPRLRPPAAVANGKEWRSHVEQTKANDQKLRDLLPKTIKQLQGLAEKMGDAKDKIHLKENYLNKQFDDKRKQYETAKTDLNALEARAQASTEKVASLTNDLAKITENLDDMKATMADRGNAMTDTSPLVNIKQSLKQLKQEVSHFDLQIGVLSHRLMQQKLRHGTLAPDSTGFKMRGKEFIHSSENKSETNKSPVAAIDYEDDDLSIAEDD